MTEEESLRKSLNELNRVTGIQFRVEADEAEDIEEIIRGISLVTEAYREKNSRTDFVRKLLTGELSEDDCRLGASRFHIPMEGKRIVFLIEAERSDSENVYHVLKHLFLAGSGDFLLTMDESVLALVKLFDKRDEEADPESVARVMIDMLNTEAMARVRVAYGTEAAALIETAEAYKEARLSLRIGDIFYNNENIFSYAKLGIGRLIYQLPEDACRLFLREVFKGDIPEIDDETRRLIDTFYENNLSVSETARQLFLHRNTLIYRLEKLKQTIGLDIRVFKDAMTCKIAFMVATYLNSMKK